MTQDSAPGPQQDAGEEEWARNTGIDAETFPFQRNVHPYGAFTIDGMLKEVNAAALRARKLEGFRALLGQLRWLAIMHVDVPAAEIVDQMIKGYEDLESALLSATGKEEAG